MFGRSVPKEDLFSPAVDEQICDSELREVFLNFISICCHFNDDRAFVKLDPYVYQEILISVCYRLLYRSPLASSNLENNDENACCLGLLALVITLLFSDHRSRRLSYDLMAGKLHNAIECALSNKLLEETTLLWLLFTGGVSVFDATDWAWLIPKIKTLLFTLKIDSWQTARDKIKILPWINAAHDTPGKELWQAVIQ